MTQGRGRYLKLRKHPEERMPAAGARRRVRWQQRTHRRPVAIGPRECGLATSGRGCGGPAAGARHSLPLPAGAGQGPTRPCPLGPPCFGANGPSRPAGHERPPLKRAAQAPARLRTGQPAACPVAPSFAHCPEHCQPTSPGVSSSVRCMPACPGNTSGRRRRRWSRRPPSGRPASGCRTSSRTRRRLALPRQGSSARDQP